MTPISVKTYHQPALATLSGYAQAPRLQGSAQERLRRAQGRHAAELRRGAAQRPFRQEVPDEGDVAGAWRVGPDWARPHVFQSGRYPASVVTRYGGCALFGWLGKDGLAQQLDAALA